ncbi:MAG: GNAT family N-acetyltransferase [Oscillospiraceae bacterium]|nr:GNAT family N-acetyltransferase [Oscillospiraceae bacterium]
MTIRHAKAEDVAAIAAIEAASYPAAEAADGESIAQRVAAFPECFWLLEEEGELRAFINGMATDIPDLADEMYHHAEMHDPKGDWQMIFSVVTAPQYRGRGYASRLMERVIRDCRGIRKGLVLTCKEEKLGFYSRFGYVNEGLSPSDHGGARWYQMRIIYPEQT